MDRVLILNLGKSTNLIHACVDFRSGFAHSLIFKVSAEERELYLQFLGRNYFCAASSYRYALLNYLLFIANTHFVVMHVQAQDQAQRTKNWQSSLVSVSQQLLSSPLSSRLFSTSFCGKGKSIRLNESKCNLVLAAGSSLVKIAVPLRHVYHLLDILRRSPMSHWAHLRCVVAVLSLAYSCSIYCPIH